MFKDINGNVSSKRIIGFLSFIVVTYMSIYGVMDGQVLLKDIIWPWMSFMTVVVTGSVLEKVKSEK